MKRYQQRGPCSEVPQRACIFRPIDCGGSVRTFPSPRSQIRANWHLAVQLLEATRALLHALRATDVAGCLLHSGTAAGIQSAMPPVPGQSDVT